MKKVNYFIIIIALSLLSSCMTISSNQKTHSEYDFVILSDTKAYAFQDNVNHLKLLTESTMSNDRIYFWGEFSAKIGTNFYSRTRERESRFAKMDILSNELTLVKSKEGDPFDMAFTEDGIYNVYIAPTNIHFEKRDLNLAIQYNKMIDVNQMTLVNKLIVEENKIYALIAIINDNQTSTNQIWTLDKQFNILNKTELNNQNSNYFDMIKVNNIFYLTSTKEGILPNGEPGPGNHVLMFNIDTAEKIKIEVGNYPKFLFFNNTLNTLIVQHDALSTQNYEFTTVNLHKKQIDTLNLESMKTHTFEDILPPLFMIRNEKYYILFTDTLIIFDPKTDEKIQFNLKEFGINRAHSIIFK